MRLKMFQQTVPADESAATFQERFVNVGSAIEPNAQTPEVVEPRVSPFHYPAEFARTAAMKRSNNDALCKNRCILRGV